MINQTEQLPCCYYLDCSSMSPRAMAELSAQARRYARLGGPAIGMQLTTCQRVEFYFCADPGFDPIERFLGHRSTRVESTAAIFVRLSEIACGVRSQLLGERFILEQVERSFTRLPHSHPVRALGNSVLSLTKRLRGAHDFFAREDHAEITLRLLAHLTDESRRIRNLLLIGGGMLSRAIAHEAARRDYDTIHLITRAPRKLRRQIANVKFRVHTTDSLPETALNVPFHVVLATDEVDKEYRWQLHRFVTDPRCVGVLDLSSIPVFDNTWMRGRPLLTMYDDAYFTAVETANSFLRPRVLAILREISLAAENHA